MRAKPGLVVLISGTGRNLQAILDAVAGGRLNADIRLVLSNRGDAYGLCRAERAGVPTRVLRPRHYPDRAAYEADLAAAIDEVAPEAVALAGFMRILGSGFVQHFSGRLVNIHPSLLPAYRGLDTHRRVLQANETRHGASVHFVTEDLDAGPVLLQGSIAVKRDDTPDSLGQRVMDKVETRIYPQALDWITSGRAVFDGKTLRLAGEALEEPIHVDCD